MERRSCCGVLELLWSVDVVVMECMSCYGVLMLLWSVGFVVECRVCCRV